MDKKFVSLFSLFFLTFTFFSILVLARDPLRRITEAQEDRSPSPSSSVLLIWPLTVTVGTPSTITAFVRSLSGKPLSDHNVTFSSTQGLIRQRTVTSDPTGKVETTITCDAPGIAEISAVIDQSTTIDQKITLECK